MRVPTAIRNPDKAAPESSSASPAAISPICHSLSSTYAAIASAARNDLERLVLRTNASNFAFSATLILVVTIVVSSMLRLLHDSSAYACIFLVDRHESARLCYAAMNSALAPPWARPETG